MSEIKREVSPADRCGSCGEWDITLAEKEHRYIIRRADDGVLVDTTGLVSVTSFAASLFPYFDGPVVLKKMRPTNRQAKYGNKSDEEILRMWSSKGERAARLGTAMHSYIEEYFDGLIKGAKPGVLPSTPPAEPDEPGSSGVIVIPESFAAVARSLADRGLVPVATEVCVYDHELRMAGTVDAIFRQKKTGDIVIFDWKRRPEYTVSSPFGKGKSGTPAEKLPESHHSKALIQLNLYRGILKRAGIFDAKELRVVTLHPDLPKGCREDALPVDEELFQAMVEYRLSELTKITK